MALWANFQADIGDVSSDLSIPIELPSRKSTVTSEEGEVTFTPEDIRPRKKKKSDEKKQKKRKKTNPENLSTAKNEL